MAETKETRTAARNVPASLTSPVRTIEEARDRIEGLERHYGVENQIEFSLLRRRVPNPANGTMIGYCASIWIYDTALVTTWSMNLETALTRSFEDLNTALPQYVSDRGRGERGKERAA